MLCIRAALRRPSLLLGIFTGSAVSGSLIGPKAIAIRPAWDDLASRGPGRIAMALGPARLRALPLPGAEVDGQTTGQPGLSPACPRLRPGALLPDQQGLCRGAACLCRVCRRPGPRGANSCIDSEAERDSLFVLGTGLLGRHVRKVGRLRRSAKPIFVDFSTAAS